ncbi:MAG: DUF2851 family protein [Rhizobacter sp.]|nr:DUF2851 family protein [Ferruginibacter sp.]
MTEKLLQYIWQFQYFNARNLQTTHGESLQIIRNGRYNVNQGPDFLNARIRIGDTEWAGSVEIHIHSSHWAAHKHTGDANYKNVILHVVWKDDIKAALPFPTLELHSLVSNILLDQYEELMQSAQFIPCQQHILKVPNLIITAWKDRLLVERLQQRSLYIETLLSSNKQHWEEVFWWMLAKNFGARINADSFEKIARTIPINLLAKHKNHLHQLEAVIMGQAALLDKKFEEDYPNMLRREYNFLQKKYQLKKAHAPLYFLRMRPANFPTVRLAQLVMLIHESLHLFSTIKECRDLKLVEKLLSVTANDYWHYHYAFGEKSAFKKKTLGRQMIHNIMINTVIPMLYAYGYMHSNESFKNKALYWLEEISAEQNSITKGFESLQFPVETAYDSQALIQLKNEYCNYKHCLQCSVGNWILKGGGSG